MLNTPSNQRAVAPSNEVGAIPWADSLVNALEHQQGMIDRLVALAESQVHSIEAGRAEELLDVLAKRQAIIDEFNASQEQITQLTRRLDERVSQAAPTQRKRIEWLIADIGQKLTQVMQRDEHDQARLRQVRDQTQHELSTVGAGKQARQAYGQVQAVRTGGATTELHNRYSDQRG